MKSLFFALAALLIVTTAMAEPRITGSGPNVTVEAGDYRVGDKVVHVAQPATFTLDWPTEKPASEQHKLTAEKPQLWYGGTHLDSVRAGGTPLPDCLDPDSVTVSLADGRQMKRDQDYLLDPRWAGFSRVEGGRIAADAPVTIAFKIGQMRLDGIEVDEQGVAHLHKGQEKMTCPHPPEASAACVAIANIFLPYHPNSIESWQIFRITEPAFPPPKVDTALVAKTLAKLRAGEPVTIVTWGDSVTAGGDSSTPDKAFAQLFPARLREQFPAAKITSHNAGIGATNSGQRLPALQKEVLDFHPDLVTIEFVNDMGHPEPAMRQRYAEIFRQIRAAGAEIILITPHFTMAEMMGKPLPRGGETRPTVPLLRDIAVEHHVALADTSRRWEHLEAQGVPYATLLTNGINHPDDRGHEMFTRDLMSFFPR